MKRKAVSGIMLSLLLIGMLTLAFDIQPVGAEPTTIIVPDEYPTIQEAINIANEGDTIFVKEGTYYEHVVVNKSISLIGENRTTTIIDGNLTRTGFHVISDNVNISGFTIRNCGPPEGGPFGGIHLDSSHNCKISGNTIINSYFGIWPDSSSNDTIFNNTLSSCSYAIGGVLMKGNNLNIFDNFLSDNVFGIYLRDSGNSIISNNTIVNSRRLSISLKYCSNIILTNNNMTGNIYGLQVFGGTLSHFIHDIDVSNTVDGKPVYYLINQSNLIIDPLAFPDIGYLGLVNSTNIVIKNLNLTRSGQGLLLAYTTRSTVMYLDISFNSRGIDIFGSSNNTITGNKITSNRFGGISFNYGCNNNTIVNNTISNTRESAILMFRSDGNIFRHNTISRNHSGIVLNSCYRNTIYHNNFINNTEQVYFFLSANTWDNGYPSGGNYWDDHVCTGNPSDGSQPYIIDENNIDHYPFQDSNGWLLPQSPGDVNRDGIVDIHDVVIAAIAFGSRPGDPNWNPQADLNNDGLIDIFDLVTIGINYGKTW